MLDLKPPAQAPVTIAAIAAVVRGLELGDNVALYILPGESHLARHWTSGPCICGYKVSLVGFAAVQQSRRAFPYIHEVLPCRTAISSPESATTML